MRNRKGILWGIMLIVSLSGYAQLKGDTYASAKQTKTATLVCSYHVAPGFVSKGTSGQMEGVCVDIMNRFTDYIEKTEGIKVTVKYEAKHSTDFAAFINEVKVSKGGVFGLSNTTITEARKKEYRFSPPYITNVGMILSHESVPTMTDLKDMPRLFAGMTALTVKNTTHEARLLKIKATYYPELPIKHINSPNESMEMVINNPKLFSLYDFSFYLGALKDKKPIKRHPGGDSTTEKFGIIMPKSNDWSVPLAEFMNAGFLESTEYRKILADNLGANALKFLDNIK